MATRKTAATVEMLKILSDGEWHSLREVAIEGSRFVPPVQAMIFRERKNEWKAQKRRAAGLRKNTYQKNLPREERVRIGSYALARMTIGNILKNHRDEYERKGDFIRLKIEGSGKPEGINNRPRKDDHAHPKG